MELIIVSFSLCVGPLLGQSPSPTPPSHGTKIAVLDFKQAVARNEIAQRVNKRLEIDLRPYTEKARALTDELAKLSQDSATNKEAIRRKAAELGALGNEVRERFAEKYEKDMEPAHQQINAAAKAVAEHYGFSIVLGHGRPEDPFDRFDSQSRKRRPENDSGPAVVFAHSSVDITELVASALKQTGPRLRQDEPSKLAGPNP
jgi:Skp family chaperone for outer membrane proteins